MNIRKATTDDIDEIRTLVLSLSGFYLTETQSTLPVWLAETLTEEQFLNRVESVEHKNLVAIYDGNLAGYICMKNDGHLYHLFVSQQHQRKGIARALWENLLKICTCSSYSVRSSLHAVPVYKRFGFVETGPVSEKDGVKFQTMELRRLNYVTDQ